MIKHDSSKPEAEHETVTVVNKKRTIVPKFTEYCVIDDNAAIQSTTVGIVATCSRRGPELEPSITAEIACYTHGSLITQNCQ